jgi:hypothetical protein
MLCGELQHHDLASQLRSRICFFSLDSLLGLATGIVEYHEIGLLSESQKNYHVKIQCCLRICGYNT